LAWLLGIVQIVLPSKRHHPVGKETDETAHFERFNTLRQSCAHLVRKALCFGKDVFLRQFRIR
jgi:insertion element IS1 protein InsB